MTKISSAFIACCMLAAAPAAKAEGAWSWTVMPYGFLPNIDGDATLGPLETLGLSVDPADILSTLDSGFMIVFEGLHDSGWGFNLDYAYMVLSDQGSFAGGAGLAIVDTFQGTLTATVFRRVVAEADRTLDLYGGFRWWDMSIDVDATLGPISGDVGIDENWVDPHIGARYIQRIGTSDWSLLAKGDIGGFGVASDFAWTLQAGTIWHARDNLNVELSYKAVGVDYDTGTPGTRDFFAYDTITHGFQVGAAFLF